MCLDMEAPGCRSPMLGSMTSATFAGVDVILENGEQLRAPILVGADGVRSRVAAHLGLKDPNYAGYIAYRWANLVTLLLPTAFAAVICTGSC